MKLWDSTGTETKPDKSKKPNSEKSKSHFTSKPHETLENQRGSKKILPI